MGVRLSELNDKQLGMISPRDRRGHLTAAEATDKQVSRREKELQSQVVGMLRRNGIYPIVNRFGKKTTTNVGCPDILFAVHGKFVGTFACAWEFKVPPNGLSDKQAAVAYEMSAGMNAWTHRVIFSYDQAVNELKALGII